jgi:formylglycine-generating enzyme required for sulfatase activity
MHGQYELNPDWKNERLPIVNVNWEEAEDYCVAAGGNLPTEAQWEFAGRAGSPNKRYAYVNDIAWFADNSGDGSINGETVWTESGKDNDKYSDRLILNHNRMHEAGALRSNNWGLDDMLGNVEEWIFDYYASKLYGAQASEDTVTDPRNIDPRDKGNSMTRGGSWYRRAAYLSVSDRIPRKPDVRSTDVGFRCVIANLP